MIGIGSLDESLTDSFYLNYELKLKLADESSFGFYLDTSKSSDYKTLCCTTLF